MESLTVNTFVRNINKSIDFYKQLGFEVVMSVPEKGDLVWAMLTNGGVSIMFQTFESLGNELPDIDRTRSGGTLLFYIKLKQIRAFFDEIKDKAEVVKELEKTFYGATHFFVREPGGHILGFSENDAT